MSVPLGYELQFRPRSGLALKHGVTLPNTPATIDSDYRGEVKVILINLSNEPQVLSAGDRIAQMVINKVEKAGSDFCFGYHFCFNRPFTKPNTKNGPITT